ncbi:MAG: hypothetical protein NTV06_08895, partial [candidate division Zixibacteria bacterium]|nr:hypothetical protein [candidate division Zixibacteria bacterium]
MDDRTNSVRINRRDNGLAGFNIIDCGLKTLLGISIVIAFLTLIQCTIKKPVAPRWTTDLAIPVVNRTYLMPEIIGKSGQPGLATDSAGEPVLSISRVLDTVKFGDNLHIDNRYLNIAEALGEVSINPANPAATTINLGDLLSLQLGVLPATSFNIQQNYPPLEHFNWAVIVSGTLNIIVSNRFGVNLDTVIISAIDSRNSRTISTITITPPGIPAGHTDTISINLAGKTISNELRLNIHCHTPGGTLLSLDGKTLICQPEFVSGLTVSSAEAEIPIIEKSLSHEMALSELSIIQSAPLSSGNIEIQLRNTTALSSAIQINMPDFRLAGVPYSASRTVGPNSTEIISLDLAGYLFEPLDQSSPQHAILEATAIIDSTAPQMVQIDQYDSLIISADLTDLSFSSMTGVINNIETNFNGLNVDLDLPIGFDSMHLSSADMTLSIESRVNLTGNIDLNITGNDGQVLHLTGEIDPGSLESPVISYIIDSNLSAFLDPIPPSITINGTASFGDGHSMGTITADD